MEECNQILNFRIHGQFDFFMSWTIKFPNIGTILVKSSAYCLTYNFLPIQKFYDESINSLLHFSAF